MKMLQALRQLGEVWVVAGSSAQRAKQIRRIRSAVKEGVRFDFVYSESATLPTALTDDDRIPRRPLLDLRFFAFCRRKGIPVGLFYRDVFWRFPEFMAGQNPVKRFLAKASYHFDLFWYPFAVDILYLPSLPMLEHVPISRRISVQALPPGADVGGIAKPDTDGHLEVLYAGGLSATYDNRRFVEALADIENLRLTICTRDYEWEAERGNYEPLMGANTRVVHQSGEELRQTMMRSHIATVCSCPNPYRKFGVPVKVYEALGAGLPIVASSDTLAGEIVEELGVGWQVPYEVDEMRDLFTRLAADRSLAEEKRARAVELRQEHSWVVRAQQVADELGAIRSRTSPAPPE